MPAASATIPAPVGGWNARDPFDLMPETDAIRLVNVFPETNNVSIRKGFSLSSDASNFRMESLFEYVSTDSTRRLVGVDSNGQMWNLTTAGSPSSLKTGCSTGRWQGVNFRNRLILVSGGDTPQQYNGTAMSDATYTGISDPTNLISVDVYKRQLFFIEENSASIWYGVVNTITGALTEYDISGQLRLGGYPMFAGSWTKDIGSGLTDLFVIVSNMGEVLAFTGDNPGASNWAIAGRYYIGAPLSRRAFCNFGADLLILAYDGLHSLNEIMGDSPNPAKFTDKIQDAFNTAVRLYSGNTGWEVKFYPRGHYILVNVPVAANNTTEQYVMNTLTGAWCRFTGQPARCWTLYNNRLYFGSETDGSVYLADEGYTDAGSAINFDIKSAFSYFKDRQRIKHFKQIRPLITVETGVTFNLDVDVDFEDRTIVATASTTVSGAQWDSAVWDSALWVTSGNSSKNWYGIGRVGRCAAYRMLGSFNNVALTMSAVNIVFEPGGVF